MIRPDKIEAALCALYQHQLEMNNQADVFISDDGDIPRLLDRVRRVNKFDSPLVIRDFSESPIFYNSIAAVRTFQDQHRGVYSKNLLEPTLAAFLYSNYGSRFEQHRWGNDADILAPWESQSLFLDRPYPHTPDSLGFSVRENTTYLDRALVFIPAFNLDRFFNRDYNRSRLLYPTRETLVEGLFNGMEANRLTDLEHKIFKLRPNLPPNLQIVEKDFTVRLFIPKDAVGELPKADFPASFSWVTTEMGIIWFYQLAQELLKNRQ